MVKTTVPPYTSLSARTMSSGISVQLGEVEVTVLPTDATNSTTTGNSSLFDQLMLLFPGAGGVGEIYHGAHEGILASSTLASDFRGVTPGVAVGDGDMEDVFGEAPGNRDNTRHFGAEQVSTVAFSRYSPIFSSHLAR